MPGDARWGRQTRPFETLPLSCRARPYRSPYGRLLGTVGAVVHRVRFGPVLGRHGGGPNVASASGVSLPWAAAERFQEIVLCTSAGSVAYTVWWLIEQPGTSIGRIALAVGAGALLGPLFARTSENALPRTPPNRVCLTTARRSRMLLVSDLAKNPGPIGGSRLTEYSSN
jgi:hypothetical protein